jgi:hypothetical protein
MRIARVLATTLWGVTVGALFLFARSSVVTAVDPLKIPLRPVAIPILSAVTVNPATVMGGTQVGGTVTLIQPASAGVTVTLQSSNPGVAPVPGSVTVQPGATSATFVVTTQPVATNPNVVPGTVSVTIAGRIGSATPKTATLTVLPPALVSLTLNPASVAGGVTSAGNTAISGPAPAGGYVITLASQNPAATVPPSVTVPSGANAATFTVTTKPVSAHTAVPIVASRGVFSTKTATLTVQPPTVAALSFSPEWFTGGYATTGAVNLTGPAPSGGANVELRVTSPTFSCWPNPTLPASVQVPSGSTAVTFTLNTSPGPTSYTSVHAFDMKASFAGKSVSGRVQLMATRVGSLVVAPTNVKGGTPLQGTVGLTTTAPASGFPPTCTNLVTLTSSNPLVAQVPATVQIPPGSNQVTFTITTSAVAQQTTVTITANPGYLGSNPQATLTVKPN